MSRNRGWFSVLMAKLVDIFSVYIKNLVNNKEL